MSRSIGKLITEVELSTEMIAFQKDEKFITDLVEQFSKIIEVNSVHRFKSNTEYFKNKDIVNIVEKIDALALKRFGIPIYSIAGNGYGIYTVMVGDNSISRKYLDRVEWQELEKDGNSIAKNMHSSFGNIRKQISLGKVVIDREKAYITGLDKVIVEYMSQDFYGVINMESSTAREIAAIFLHEVGHAFTHIEYSTRQLRTPNVIMDTVLEDVKRNNEKPLETLKLIYKELGGDVKDIENKKGEAAVYFVVSKAIENFRNINDTYVSSVDSEQLADQFVARLGLGKELITGFDRVFSKYRKNKEGHYALRNGGLVTASVAYGAFTTSSIILAVGSLASPLAISAAIAAGLVITAATVIGSSLVDGLDYRTGKTYDDDKRRLIRVRNDLVKQLRLTINNDKALAKLLENLDTTDAVIKNMPNEPFKLNEYIYALISKHGKDTKRMEITMGLIEDLMSNELYVKSEKLKLISKRA